MIISELVAAPNNRLLSRVLKDNVHSTTGVSMRTIESAIEELRAKGRISRRRCGKDQRNVYLVLIA